MPTTVTINGVQREVFYELVLDHLSGIGDLLVAVEHGDFGTAERLGIEFGEDLEDLGWDSAPVGEADLTMPSEDLTEALTPACDQTQKAVSTSLPTTATPARPTRRPGAATGSHSIPATAS